MTPFPLVSQITRVDCEVLKVLEVIRCSLPVRVRSQQILGIGYRYWNNSKKFTDSNQYDYASQFLNEDRILLKAVSYISTNNSHCPS